MSNGPSPATVTRLPRSQAGANPQRVMAALLGDYWIDREEFLPSASLVDLVAEFGVTAASARAALSRLLRRGTLEVHRSGRTTHYRLSPVARLSLRRTGDDLLAAVGPAVRPWDGHWTVVAFSVREDRREVRHSLRSALRRLGFAPLYDGVWAAPHGDGPELADLLARLSVEQATVLRSDVLHPLVGTAGHPAQIWGLDQVRGAWASFAAARQALAARLDGDRVTPQEALTERLALLDDWAGLTAAEPALPAELLPADWPRARAAQAFVRAADGLAPLAERRVREILAREAPDLAPLALARRTSR